MEDEQPPRLVVTILVCLLISLPVITLIGVYFSAPQSSESIELKPTVLEDSNSILSPNLFIKAQQWLSFDQNSQSMRDRVLPFGPNREPTFLNTYRSRMADLSRSPVDPQFSRQWAYRVYVFPL
jgi:hypothetical protein